MGVVVYTMTLNDQVRLHGRGLILSIYFRAKSADNKTPLILSHDVAQRITMCVIRRIVCARSSRKWSGRLRHWLTQYKIIISFWYQFLLRAVMQIN